MKTPELTSIAEISLPIQKSRRVNWGFWIWVWCSLILTFGVAVVGTAWAVRHTLESGRRLSDSQQESILKIAHFPVDVVDVYQNLLSKLSIDPTPQLIMRNSTEQPYWIKRFPMEADPGYLLLSGVSHETKSSNIRLIRISDGKSMATWSPNWDHILNRITEKRHAPKTNISNAQAIHPILMSNGDIIFNTGGALVRMGACNNDIKWILDEVLHHSNELDINGDIWSPYKAT
jgi:hypothetical protein